MINKLPNDTSHNDQSVSTIMMDKIRTLCKILNKISMLAMCAYMTTIIYIYLGENIWNARIPTIGDVLGKRILMGIHFITGLICMYGYLIQIHMSRWVSAHMYIGIFLYINLAITILCGILFGFIYGTIGGIVMDAGFIGYGLVLLILLIVSVVHIVMNRGKIYYKLYHVMLSNIFCVLIYASALYRIQYIFAALFGYKSPDNVHTDRYLRPLDRVFVFSFYLIPLLVVSTYNYAIYTKQYAAKRYLYIAMTLVNMFIGALAMIGCIYHQR